MKTISLGVLILSSFFITISTIQASSAVRCLKDCLDEGIEEVSFDYVEGTHFTSGGVSLTSRNTVSLLFESADENHLAFVVKSDVDSSQLTIEGLSPDTTYYIYIDSYENHREFISSASGVLTFDLDLSDDHRVMIQDQPSTIILTADTVLTEDVYETIQIDADGITLDCDGHYVYGNGFGDGIYVAEKSYVTIKNCNVSDWRNGIYVYGGTSNIIYNNSLDLNHSGIRLNLSSKAEIKNNDVKGGSTPIVIFDGDYNLVENNTTDSTIFFGIAFLRNNYNTIQNNTVNTTVYTGIYMDDCDNNLIQGNTSSAIGIDYGSLNTIKQNTTTAAFIGLGSSNNSTISNNNIYAVETVHGGVYLYKSEHILVKGNRIYDSNWHGILLEGSSNNAVSNNTILSPFQAGIDVIYGSSMNTVESNTIHEASNGIAVRVADSNMITGNAITESSSSGIYTDYSNDNEIEHNNITGSGAIGIFLSNSDYNYVKSNLVLGPDGGGIYTDQSSHNTLQKNNITDVSGVGIWLHWESHYNRMMSNTITDTGYYNVLLSHSDFNAISKNYIKESGLIGVYVGSGADSNNLLKNDYTESGLLGWEEGNDEEGGAIKVYDAADNYIYEKRFPKGTTMCDQILDLGYGTVIPRYENLCN